MPAAAPFDTETARCLITNVDINCNRNIISFAKPNRDFQSLLRRRKDKEEINIYAFQIISAF